ncbi:MAG: ChuX/HutX family heme-like substrate-binding protein [Gammaproteobacteria bacterium]
MHNRKNRTARIVVAASILCLPALASAGEASALCATAEQKAQIAPLYAANPVPPPFMAARKLGLPEAVIASALPVARATGVSAEEFGKVWESLQGWDEALTLVLKGANVFEIHGRVPPGEPSTRSAFFNLKAADAGLGGHLRPDLLGAIYAVNLNGPEGPMRGVTFLDQQGEGVFGVYLPESREPSPALVAQFDRTQALMAAMPRLCQP